MIDDTLHQLSGWFQKRNISLFNIDKPTAILFLYKPSFQKNFVFVIERWFEVSPLIYIDNVIADLFPLIETFYRIFWMRGLCFYYITTIRTLLCSIMISVFYLLQLMPFLYKNPSYNKVTIRILVVEWLCICTTEYKSIH